MTSEEAGLKFHIPTNTGLSRMAPQAKGWAAMTTPIGAAKATVNMESCGEMPAAGDWNGKSTEDTSIGAPMTEGMNRVGIFVSEVGNRLTSPAPTLSCIALTAARYIIRHSPPPFLYDFYVSFLLTLLLRRVRFERSV